MLFFRGALLGLFCWACQPKLPDAQAPAASGAVAPTASEKPEAAPVTPSSEGGHVHAQAAGAEHVHPSGHVHSDGYEMDFSEVERFARHFDDPARDAWQQPEAVVKLLRVAPGDAVVDLGAGTGYFLPYLARAVGPAGRVIALDVEPNMVTYMKRRAEKQRWPNVEARVVAADDPGLPKASVDRILIVNTWHHIGARPEYARRLAEALEPSGEVLIVDFTRDSDIGPPPDHRLSPEQVARELEAGGLRVHQVEQEALPKQYVVRGVRAAP